MKSLWSIAAACLLPAFSARAEQPLHIHFNQQIRPILSDNCFACHGPDAKERKGKLRLDAREAAIEKQAIVPGRPDESELIKRIFTTDEDDMMPPRDSHKALTAEQKELFKKWIAEGAAYEGHWSYTPPVKSAVPAGKKAIDHLINERLKALGIEPAPRADRRTLARRLYSDLIGLPPAPEEVSALENDSSPDAVANLIEKLLASPHHGERMAIPWLDIVRFADTIGYHSDNPRNIWPYRDYVIRAFNENKRFDQFTREQVAGDLLPESGLEQKVASGFNRLLLSTEEGGAQPKDYEARMLTDRVRAVGTVWLGQTLGCAACHDHKFDPITQRDFYAMGAFFADIQEPIIGKREDGMLVPTPAQAGELKARQAKLEALQKEFDGPHPELAGVFDRWEKEQTAAWSLEKFWSDAKPAKAESAGGATLEAQSNGAVLAKGKNPDKDTYVLEFFDLPNPVSALRIEALPHDSLPAKGSGRAGNGNFVITEVTARLHRANGDQQALPFLTARASFEQVHAAEKNPGKKWAANAVIDGEAKGGSSGWAILPEVTRPQQLVLELAQPVKLEEGDKLRLEIAQNHGHGSHLLGHFRVAASSSLLAARGPLASAATAEIAGIFRAAPEKRDDAQKQKLFARFKAVAPELDGLRAQLQEARKAKADYEGSIARTLVSVSSDQPRAVRVLPRGNFLNETGEIVEPALPHYLLGGPAEKRRLTRLDLADWLVSRENPLTARVVMNRLWKQFFGAGLSRVLDDLGAQGEPPANLALLDWLACEFMDSGWDLRHMVRLIANSEAYQRSSQPPPALRARDPLNREAAAQGRWRADAELVRDHALSVAGLLAPEIGGPSVKPYQPDGYWENLNFPVRAYDANQGAGQYRRGLYTWWQRSYVHPSMIAFDAATREECVAERNRSNIPQQALVLLNDPTYVEASRVFAARILRQPGDAATRITWAWRQALARAPRTDELQLVTALLQKHLAEYKDDPKSAEAFLSVGQAYLPGDLEKSELAAWANVARVIFNLHESITRS